MNDQPQLPLNLDGEMPPDPWGEPPAWLVSVVASLGCPFCGGRSHLIPQLDDSWGVEVWHVSDDCPGFGLHDFTTTRRRNAA